MSAACDPVPGKAADFVTDHAPTAAPFDDLTTMLGADLVDAVCVCTPHPQHAAVVEALKAKLAPTKLAASHRTSNTEAYNQYLLGRQFFNRNNVEDVRRAVGAYHKAIALTFFKPRTSNRTSPRLRACALTHSAVAARSL